MRIINGILLLLTLTLFIASSCNEAQEEKVEDTVDTIGSKVESGLTGIKDEIDDFRDETFVANVLDENAEVLYLLRLAGTKGTAEYVKDAARKMKKDHEDLRESFASYARTHNIDFAEIDYKDNLETKERGQDWDADWNREMRNKHEKLINKFERKADNANDPELQQLAKTTISVLRGHLSALEQYNY